MAKQAAEIIAFHLSQDWSEVKDSRYHPTQYSRPNIYVVGEDYYCCPRAGKWDTARPHRYAGLIWRCIGQSYGRDVWEARHDEPEESFK